MGHIIGAILAGLGWVDETLIPALRATVTGILDRLVENWPVGLLVLAVCVGVLIEAVD